MISKLERNVEAFARGFFALVVLPLVLILAFSDGCAGVEVRAEGCYYEPPYGRVCVSATRTADGKIVVEVRADVGDNLPADVRARAVAFGESLVKKPPGE